MFKTKCNNIHIWCALVITNGTNTQNGTVLTNDEMENIKGEGCGCDSPTAPANTQNIINNCSSYSPDQVHQIGKDIISGAIITGGVAMIVGGVALGWNPGGWIAIGGGIATIGAGAAHIWG